MGGVKDYDPFAFVAFAIWGFFLYFILSTNSPINPIGTNSTLTNQFNITYTNTKWMLYLLIPMLPYLILRFWHQADTEGDNPSSGGLHGFHFGGNIRGRVKSVQKQIAHGEKPKPSKLPTIERIKSEIEQ
jgi:hypothetical protein